MIKAIVLLMVIDTLASSLAQAFEEKWNPARAGSS